MQLQKISKLPPTEGIGISWGVGGSVRPKNLKKCMKLNWNFQRGGGGLRKNPFHGGVWMFSGITQYENRIALGKQLHCMWSVEVGNITREALKDKL